MTDELKKLIEQSDKILITSHISPDGDSISSSLLLYKILTSNYSDKKIAISMEEKPFGLDFLPESDKITFQPLIQALEDAPNLLFILDANALHRITRHPDAAHQALQKAGPKVVIIDHHEGMDFDSPDIYINNKSPATTLEIYEIFIEKLGLKKPKDYAQITLTGIYTDTGGFVYQNMNFDKTFEIVPKLIADGASVELIANNLSQISEKTVEITAELYKNTKFEEAYTYTYLTDETATLQNLEALLQALEIIRATLLRNVGKRTWGFVVYRDVMAVGKVYSVSFRALSNTTDVAEIARRLGGGGHKPAAGARFKAKNVEEALEKVKAAIVE